MADAFRTVVVMEPRIAVIEIVAADLAASLAFYRRLGVDVPADAADQPHVDVELPGGLRMAWDTEDVIRSFDAEWTAATAGRGRVSLAFDCETPAQVDATYAELVAAGHHGHLPPWDAFWGMRYAVVHDPDGNGVDLFATLPEA